MVNLAELESWKRLSGQAPNCLRYAQAALVAALLTLSLQGCWEETCDPHPLNLYTSCHERKSCSAKRGSPYVVQGVTLSTCFRECAYQNCTVVQWDCDARCLLLSECGSEEESDCSSTIYYMNVGLLTTTTTTTTMLGACFDGVPPNEDYLCSPASHCRNQVSGINLGLMSLPACLDECDLRWNCRSVQYTCGEQCWILGSGCGAELQSRCGSSVYHKAAYTSTTVGPTVSLDVSTTSSTQDLSATCFNGVIDDGTYECRPMSNCRNQAFAAYMGKLSLPECMSGCDKDEECTAFVHECTGVCQMMVGLPCDGEIPLQMDVFRGGCGTLYRKVLPTTTQVPNGCFPGLGPTADYECQPFMTCAGPDNALNLGAISLQSCMDQCELYNCAAIQHNCGNECWILTSCPELVPSTNSSCPSSVYLRDQLWPFWVATTTTTTVAGECRPNSRIPLLDFSCQPQTFCIEEATATKLGVMSIERCSEMCRGSPFGLCVYFQYNCNNECSLLTSCSPSSPRGNCSSSVYMKLFYAREASQHFFFDRNYAFSYSEMCSGRGCEVTAYCPYQTFVVNCEITSPSRSRGIFIPQRDTNGFCIAYGSGPVIRVEAICSSRVVTRGYYPEPVDGIVSLAECPENQTMMACSCYADFDSDPDACSGSVFFKPTFSDIARPRCEIEGAGPGARIGAICAEGYNEAVLRNSGLEYKLHSGEEVQYCGWVAEGVNSAEADCRGWMQDPSNEHVGGCKTTECLDLADCVQKCNSCGACAGVLHVDNGDPLYEGKDIQCTMVTKDTTPSSFNIGKVSGRGDVLYVNTRHPACDPSHDIKRLAFFEDKDCTAPVYPESVKVGNTTVQSGWSDLQPPFVPECSPYCPISGIVLSASFPAPTSVQCAIVHSTLGFAKGWELYNAKSTLGTSTGPKVALDQTPSLPASFQKGTVVTFESPMVLWCQNMYSDCVRARNWAPTLSWQFAQMLGIPVHMLFLKTGLWRSQWADYRRLEDDGRHLQEGIAMGFRINIKIVIDTPMNAELVLSVAADLKAMVRKKKLVENVLNRAVPMELELGAFGEFTRTVYQPVRMFFPPPTVPPPTTTTTTIEVQEGDDEDRLTQIIAGVGAGVVGLSLALTLALVFHRQHRKRKAQREREEARKVSSHGPDAIVIGGKAMIRTQSRDLVLPLSEEALRYLPTYWTSGQDAVHLSYALVSKDYLAFSHLVYVSHEHLQLFQDLVNFTYRGITTQDRLCPTEVHEKTRGGCPCVRPGGDPGLPTGYQVKRVIRIEDGDKYSRYIQRRKEISEKRDFCDSPDPPMFTSDAMAELSGMSEILSNLNEDINEVYMWHGAPLRTGLQIAREDFQLAFAGSGAGTMYGKALYFSESVTKADEYARDEPGGHYADVRALLLCRICLGKYHYTLDREPAAEDKFKMGESDSTFGDRAKSVGTYREVALYDPNQVYPEYLVLYERLHGSQQQTPPSKEVPFLLELPLYWKNVAKNPYVEGFREQWVVKIAIKELIQRLVTGSCRGRAPVVQAVRRIEDSGLWCRYINWKRNLSRVLQSDGLTNCVPPHELDTSFGGEVLTAKIQAEAQGNEAISVENMAPGLNELLLWHGTSKQAAESIAEEGFMVNETHTHGRRFGPGIYLAEDLTKSMSYCKRYDGVVYVLLCRAVCGHLHYTEEDHNYHVGDEAREAQKTCVLANPNKNGPREYILFDASQVYPEYIIELRPS